ncbi:MAG TPA: S-methyl-5'-thioinosine phosphorylase [Burkholderiaceae bacterium]|jgi:5'-methylthioadenosine phosphorylase|nr:S-methyl-5'-thioinosine phosphorylase [Burkholderiaceae bacterium]
MKFAIIGGSGLARLAGLEQSRRQVVRTPYGDPSGPLTFGRLDGIELVFLARHGYGHTIAPHEINYRANIWALHNAGVDGILSVATVGGIRAEYGPGALVLPDQLIDYTWGRRSTFFEGPEQPVTHIDFTLPYDDIVRDRFAQAAASLGETLALTGTYGCTQGPRLETAAEIRRMQRDGCDLVGMTGMPEAALARELAVPYAALAVVANHAAGMGDSAAGISLEAISATLDLTMARVHRLLGEFVRIAARGQHSGPPPAALTPT